MFYAATNHSAAAGKAATVRRPRSAGCALGNFMHQHRWCDLGWQGPPSLPWGPCTYCFLWARVNLPARAEVAGICSRGLLTLLGGARCQVT